MLPVEIFFLQTLVFQVIIVVSLTCTVVIVAAGSLIVPICSTVEECDARMTL
jgi:hypothetical protein